MNSIPIYWSKPGLQLPRPDRLHFKSLLGRKKRAAAADQPWIPALVAAYGLSLLKPAITVGVNGRSNNWLLVTSAGTKVLKKYKPTVEAQQILQEHSILSELARIDFPAPRLNKNLRGKTLTEFADSRFGLFDYLDGYFHSHEQMYFPSQASTFLELAAISLASLHNALPGFTPVGKNPNGFISQTGPRWRDSHWYLEVLTADRQHTEDLLKSSPGHQLAVIHERGQWIEDRLMILDELLSAAPLDRVIIHGDYGPYNLLFKNGSPVVMIDFELARLDWRLTDLAASMNTFARNRFGFQPKKMRQFVQAYQSVSNVSAEQLHYLPAVWQYLSLRRLIICWNRALETGQPSWLVEAQDRVRMIDWITTHKDDMQKLVSG